MSKQVIDSVFEKIIDIKHIEITGGEPFLAIDELEYLVNKLIDSNWTTETFTIITNGTIADQRIVKLLSALCIKKNMCVFIPISTDVFHWESKNGVATKQNDTIEYYRQHFKKLGVYNDLIDTAKQNGTLDTAVTSGICILARTPEPKTISYIGLAKDLIDNAFVKGEITIESQVAKYKGYIPMIDITSDDRLQKYAHRISVKNNTVGCRLNITANGDVTNLQDYTFETIDKFNFGNILYDDFETIIDNQNEKAVFNCWESYNVIKLYSQLMFNHTYSLMPYVRLQIFRYEIICNLRKLIKINIPDYDIAYIIDMLPIPTESEWIDILVDLYNSIYTKNIKHIDSIFDFPYTLMQELIDMLNDSKINYSGKYSMYLNKNARELIYNSDLLKQFDIEL